MKRCIQCDHVFENLYFKCSNCNFSPVKIDSFLAFAPELCLQNDSYNPEAYQAIIKFEAENFWFKYRNKLIIDSIKKYCLRFDNLLELGCGTGFVLAELCRHFSDKKIYGSEIYISGLKHTAQRISNNVNLLQLDCKRMPFVNEFDIIGAFDVLEHIEEDVHVLREINQALTANGYIIVTVPQHPFLWSQTDIFAHHIRRYTAKELISKFKMAGFKIFYRTSFITFLMPALFLSRLNKKKLSSKFLPELQIHPVLNYFFKNICELEYQFIKRGFSFPCGGSLLMIGQKA